MKTKRSGLSGRSADVVRLDLPATHKYLNVLGASLAEILARVEGLAERETSAYNVQLAVHEVCTNIVSHAYAGRSGGRIRVTLTLAFEPRRLIVELRDSGIPFDLAAAPEPRLDEPQVHGYGLFLVRQLMDEVSYQSGARGNRWRLVKRL